MIPCLADERRLERDSGRDGRVVRAAGARAPREGAVLGRVGPCQRGRALGRHGRARGAGRARAHHGRGLQAPGRRRQSEGRTHQAQDRQGEGTGERL